jgi:hypothetical protein
MRKRLAMFWTLVVLGLALMLPASTAAASYGNITNTNTWCTSGGNRVNATFNLHKYSGFYATKLQMTAYGQIYSGGKWHSVYNIGTWWKNISTYGVANFKYTFWYNDAEPGSDRVYVVAKIMDGGSTLATGHKASAFCG